MNTNELRKGNIVDTLTNIIHLPNNRPMIIYELHTDHVISYSADKESIELLKSDLHVVQNTKLVGMLLDKTFVLNHFTAGKSWLSITNLKAELHFDFYGDEIVTTIKSSFCELILDRIQYVHQLQNLFLVLANEELKYIK